MQSMKILGVIDHFGSGGAQRQMVELFCGLKGKGHDVEMFIYYPKFDFFRSRLTAMGIPVHEVNKRHRISPKVVASLAALLRKGRFDIALSYLETPNVYAELAAIAANSTKVVVSERSSHHRDRSTIAASVKRQLHRLSDYIVVNSSSHQEWLERNCPWLNQRVCTIRNGYDLSSFHLTVKRLARARDLQLLGIGRIAPEKNMLGLVRGLVVFHERHGWAPAVDWVGRRGISAQDRRYGDEVDELLSRHPEVSMNWSWLGERLDVAELLRDHHALIHPALYEGLPNVVCEALAAGRPVLLSNVCDHPSLAGADHERGFLFSPSEPDSIAAAIEDLLKVSPAEWTEMSKRCRDYAEAFLSIDTMVAGYELLFERLLETE